MDLIIQIKQSKSQFYNNTFQIPVTPETSLNKIKQMIQSTLGKAPFFIPPDECKHFRLLNGDKPIYAKTINRFQEIQFDSQPPILGVLWTSGKSNNSPENPTDHFPIAQNNEQETPSNISSSFNTEQEIPSHISSSLNAEQETPSNISSSLNAEQKTPSNISSSLNAEQEIPSHISSSFNAEQEEKIAIFLQTTQTNRNTAISYLTKYHFALDKALNAFDPGEPIDLESSPDLDSTKSNHISINESEYVKNLILQHPYYLGVLIEHVEDVNKQAQNPPYPAGFFRENPQEYAKLLNIDPNLIPQNIYDDIKQGKGRETLDVIQGISSLLDQQKS